MSFEHRLFDTDVDGSVLVIFFRAPCVNDSDYLEELEDGLRGLNSAYEQRYVLLDFSEVEMIVSRMINSLVSLVKRVRAEGGQVHLCCLHPRVESVFKTMRLDRVFDMYDSKSDALETMKALEAQLQPAQFA